MNHKFFRSVTRLAVPGALLLALGSCLGPNPGFFITTTAASAAIGNFVNQLINGLAP